ncbi:MAG: hypothetical protein ACXQTJ_00335 [Candidatus Syntropharchaeales archaeon]|uniref:Uncharacterized protein n=1 Tax=Candidatus Syntropharchaeum caldarium TaxID=1838285 RepID=A0A1F2PDR1_9EURY|nr:MAG: hypothetical protein SCAL_000462 [Candidatus Syntrophoarchaeum caldarius]
MRRTIAIKPEPGKCIETVAKGRYWKAVDEYLKNGGKDTDLEEEIELLRSFLEDPEIAMYRARIEDEQVSGRQAYLLLAIDDAGFVHKEVLVEKENYDR